MKKFFAALVSVLSMSSYAQSYMVLNNGIVITTAKDGSAYDLSNFALPKDIQFVGGQFYVHNNKLVTVNEGGLLFVTDVKIKEIDGKGINYLIENKELTTISSQGIVTKLKNDAFKKAEKFGGTFFITNVDEKKKLADLYTVGANGLYTKIDSNIVNASDISLLGGNYFFVKGVPYTVAKDGLVWVKSDFSVPSVKHLGGNFFIDSTDALYTVADKGYLIIPTDLPVEFKIANVVKVGSNYMLDNENRLFTVDENGNVFYKSFAEHDLKKVKILSTK